MDLYSQQDKFQKQVCFLAIIASDIVHEDHTRRINGPGFYIS